MLSFYANVCKCIVVLLLVCLAATARGQDATKACAIHLKQYSDDSPHALRLADYDCARLRRPQLIGSPTNKNEAAQYMHGVQELRKIFGIEGRGIRIGVWDAGRVLAEHIELAGRVTVGDAQENWRNNPKKVPLHEHATHVAGTIGSAGSDKPAAGGMAPKAHVVSYYWDNDVAELKLAPAAGISVTNHSYAIPAGWELGGRGKCAENWSWLGGGTEVEDARFGAYDFHSRDFDDVVWRNQSLSIFVAAGNERGDTGNPELFRADPRPDAKFDGSHCSYNETSKEWKSSTTTRSRDGSEYGFDTITGRGLGKNVITIGAAVDLTVPFEPTAVRSTSFSSMGPADDGRIKPDLLANGDELTSTYLPQICLRDLGNTCWVEDIKKTDLRQYASLPGTSMAAPVAAGIGALLNELALRRLKRVLFADEMKAALIHTALATTDTNSPTYATGWGLIRASRAGALIDGQSGTLIRRSLGADGRLDIPFVWNVKAKDLSVTVVWIDAPGSVVEPPPLNDRRSTLINKLVVRLLPPSNVARYPWSLDVAAPNKVATRSGPNLIDNAQRIDVNSNEWESGIWRLTIENNNSHAAALDLAIAANDVAKLE